MLKFVNNIRVTFNPYGTTASSAKVFLNRIMTNDNIASNPKCKIAVETPDAPDTIPSIQIDFRKHPPLTLPPSMPPFPDPWSLNPGDGKQFAFNTSKMNPNELVGAMTKYTKKLQEEEDNRG
ncbi:hypothetical protein IWQ60_005067 [Tieghemiomyces parasiticus]|uniref:Large ribosomal subunit protein mL53 n=1 Tax=Tieghemiomyces parasiticus TaxID=78921 RepID=A0A9W8A741_9FUNG|nr:hypothetical protein IWQ60_005067 [Tieghemiomyces parasiticus]